ncbi:unnamed protein product [Fusarium venenatum]|uniref:Uncharacterized protein n=1 Tax=Fusarium venenatum TaxID=56646 RepID=A0A2L2U3I4_9HYPO|nr:uncharacterized protein FVRRES_09412 [Fusarium venenatum]CEI69335.1 unnamed protein product [Fusarium venenatum]
MSKFRLSRALAAVVPHHLRSHHPRGLSAKFALVVPLSIMIHLQ